LERLGVRRHARRSIQFAIQSLGISPKAPPAHARGHRASIAVRGRGFALAYLLRRPPNPRLQLSGAPSIAVSAYQDLLMISRGAPGGPTARS
jgi:hypothetical protein